MKQQQQQQQQQSAVGPMPAVWRRMVADALRAYPHPDCMTVYVMGNAVMSGTEIRTCQHAVYHAHQVAWRVAHEDERWFQPRFAAPLLAIEALSMSLGDPSYGEQRASFLASAAAAHIARALPDFDVDCIVTDGIINCDWQLVQEVACARLRAEMAARSIQRAVRRGIERRKACVAIQRAWRGVIADPGHPACVRRLLHEYGGLAGSL
jgi:hypothetical protein